MEESKLKDIPKYEAIALYIKEAIASGKYKKDSQLPTEKELVELFDVSRPTVVRAMDKLLAEKIIYRVQGKGSYVSGEYEKEDNVESNIISLVLPFAEYRDAHRFDELNIIKGMESYFRENGYFLMIHYCDNNESSFLNTVEEIYRASTSEGMILYPPENVTNIVYFYNLMLDKYPIVLIDKPITGLQFPCIQTDDIKGGYLATKHLIECQYKALYFVSDVSITQVPTARDRYFGFLKATKEAGVQTDNSLIYTREGVEDLTLEKVREIIDILLDRHPDERIGLFMVNDDLVRNTFPKMMQVEVEVPERFGLVGFGGMNMPLYNNIKMTTIAQEFYDIGKLAAKTMCSIIDDTWKGKLNILTDVTLETGGTTSKPKLK